MTTSQQDSISSKDYTRPPSTDELLVRAAGWLAAPEGESRQSTIELITGLVRSIKGFKKICAMHGLDTGLSALRDSNETPAPQAGADFDKDWARLEGIRSTMRDMQRYSLQGVPQSEVMFLLGFIDNLWRTFSRTDAKLEQYTKALWTANGFLIQLGREPVKLEYGPRLQQETNLRPCTCHPDDDPPRPCPQKFALSECRAAAGMCRKHGKHSPGICPKCDELAEARMIVSTVALPPAKAGGSHGEG